MHLPTRRQGLIASTLLIMNFPVWMGLWVWFTESVEQLRNRNSDA